MEFRKNIEVLYFFYERKWYLNGKFLNHDNSTGLRDKMYPVKELCKLFRTVICICSSSSFLKLQSLPHTQYKCSAQLDSRSNWSRRCRLRGEDAGLIEP